jgi:hypothetical protein
LLVLLLPLLSLQGNVILTDHKYEVLTLLRSHRDDDKGLSIMAKHPYPMQAVRLRQPLQLETLKTALAAAAASAGTPAAAAAAAMPSSFSNGAGATAAADGAAVVEDEVLDDYDDGGADGGGAGADASGAAAAAAAGQGKKRGGRKASAAAAGPVLKAVVADVVPYGPAIAEHCCLAAGLQPQLALQQQQLSEAQILSLFAAVQSFESWLAALDQGAAAEGLISAVPSLTGKKDQAAASTGQQQQQQQTAANGSAAAAAAAGGVADGGAGLVYQDYNPLVLEQLARSPEQLRFPTFDEALDEFYSKVCIPMALHESSPAHPPPFIDVLMWTDVS